MPGALPPDDLDELSQPIDWEAYQHHRQAYLDRDQIAALEEMWEVGPDDLDELLRDDSSGTEGSSPDDDDPPRWIFIR